MTQVKNILSTQTAAVINLGSYEKQRIGHSACAFKNQALYIIAGATKTMSVHNCQKSVYCFKLAQKHFVKAPNLNKKRFYHASCVHSGKIFAFGGWEGVKNGSINTIERLDVEGNAKAWELFTFNEVRGVQHPIVSTLNSSEILILGGIITKNLGSAVEPSFDAFVLNEGQMVVRKVRIDKSEGTSGRAVMIIPGKVIWIRGANDEVRLYDSNTETV